MDKEKRNTLNKGRHLRQVAATFRIGLFSITHEMIRMGMFITALIIVVIGDVFNWNLWMMINRELPDFFEVSYNAFHRMYGICAVLFILLVVYCSGSPLVNKFKIENGFRRIGLVNNADEPPFLIRYYYDPARSPGYIYVFDSTGIPLSEWEERKEAIETALNCRVVSFTRGDNLRTVVAHMVTPDYEPHGAVPWNDEYASEKEFEIALGMGITGVEYANLDVVSHALIAGSTGSGKTIMLKSIIYQCIKKQACVILVDFKGGANFSIKWRTGVEFITNEQELSTVLNQVLEVLDRRKRTFADFECENIVAYCEKTGETLRRIIIVFDEVAQCFDKTGLNTADKKTVQELEHKMAIIARLGRAFGIHLILGLQRPDATVVTGQIKSNIDLRMCGRSDDTLSMIVLDNTDAARKIGSYERGKFMLNNGHLIQGFLFRDEDYNL